MGTKAGLILALSRFLSRFSSWREMSESIIKTRYPPQAHTPFSILLYNYNLKSCLVFYVPINKKMGEISSFLFKDNRVMDILDYSCLALENKFWTFICTWVSLQFHSKWNMEVMLWRSTQEELITSPYFTSASLISSILHFILNLWKFSSSLGLRQAHFRF